MKPPSTSDALTVYPAPAGAAISSWYTLAANGHAVPVYDAQVDEPHNCAFASFDGRGPVRVEITPAAAFQTVKVRPLSAGIAPQINGASIAFVVDRPCRLSVELDGNISRPLLVFYNHPLADAPPGGPNVRHFGPGLHEAGQIVLQSNQTVVIAGGAVVRGFFTAENASHIRILGRGIMDAHENKSCMIRFTNCQDVLVEGIIIADQPQMNWTTVFTACDDVVVRNIKIIAGDNVSNDGIDLVSCHRALVEDCFVKCFDDCIVLKALRTNRRDIEDITVRNCLLWNIQAYGVQIGAELDCAHTRRIRVENCDIIHAQQTETDAGDRYLYYSGALGILNGDDGEVSEVVFDDIRVEDGANRLISVKIMKSEWNHTAGYGTIRDITFRKVRLVDGIPLPSEIISYGIAVPYAPNASAPAHIPSDITIEDLEILGRAVHGFAEGGFTIEPFCKNLKFVVNPAT